MIAILQIYRILEDREIIIQRGRLLAIRAAPMYLSNLRPCSSIWRSHPDLRLLLSFPLQPNSHIPFYILFISFLIDIT
jgi:hypothetical protein